MTRRRCALLAAVLLVPGCAGLDAQRGELAQVATAERSAARRAALAGLDEWRLLGRVAVQRDDQGFSADLDWRQRGEAFEMRIAAPLGGGTFALSGTRGQVALVTPEGAVHAAADAEALMAEHLGWRIPVSGAHYWVRGIPSPDGAVSAERLDAEGRWTDFAQAGWRVSILDYREEGEPELPRKLFLARDALQVRMVVRRWELP